MNLKMCVAEGSGFFVLFVITELERTFGSGLKLL